MNQAHDHDGPTPRLPSPTSPVSVAGDAVFIPLDPVQIRLVALALSNLQHDCRSSPDLAALAAEESVRGTGRVSVDVRMECNFVLALIRDRR